MKTKLLRKESWNKYEIRNWSDFGNCQENLGIFVQNLSTS